jgi:hypothetical protein
LFLLQPNGGAQHFARNASGHEICCANRASHRSPRNGSAACAGSAWVSAPANASAARVIRIFRNRSRKAWLYDRAMNSRVPATRPTTLEAAALCYLALPLIVFLCGFLHPAIAAVSAGCLAILIALAISGASGAGPNTRTIIALVAFACAWTSLTGILPPFGQTGDWPKHYALFNALAQQAWPPAFADENGTVSVLRYALGWYMVPGLIGQLGGPPLADAAIFLWTATGVFLFGALVVQQFTPRVAAIVLVVFVLFSGADAVGAATLSCGPGSSRSMFSNSA